MEPEAPVITLPKRPVRSFLPEELVIDSWEVLLPYFENLRDRSIETATDLEQWLLDRSELDAILEEDMAWRYIKMNIDTTDEKLSDQFNFFVTEIEPKIAPFDNGFDKKLIESTCVNELDKETYHILLRGIKKSIELYREENIPLLIDLAKDAQKFGAISAKQMVEIDGEEVTMQKAATYYKDTNREKRETVFNVVKTRRAKDEKALDELYTGLISLRHKVAHNAGYANFRDYKFASMGRFDYSPQDCFDFHKAIQYELVPIVKGFHQERKEALGYKVLKPWDMEVDISGLPPLKPFDSSADLVAKTIKCLAEIRPFFGECLHIMKEMGHLDLESKVGKAPGGFNYPLYEIGVPFIYMNAVGSQRDVVTMVHEAGHAIHSFHCRPLTLCGFKSTPSEVAELASMSMELISMEHWEIFLTDEAELKRAKKEQLEKIISILPWIALVDKYQHWIYTNPSHSNEDRKVKWEEFSEQFSTGVTDWSGHEDVTRTSWQRQLHLYEVPFYYIEYAMAQLGAIALWKNYKENPEKTLDQYEAALKLGYTRSIGEIYEAAGIKFDFSQENVKTLAEFVKSELDKL